MRTGAKTNGFSVVELMAAMTAASLLALTAGIMLFFTYRAWSTNKAIVERQQDGHVVMTLLARSLRDSTNALCAPTALIIDATNATRRFRTANQALFYCPDVLYPSGEMLIATNVLEFASSNVTAGVGVRLVLQTVAGAVTQDTTIHFRN